MAKLRQTAAVKALLSKPLAPNKRSKLEAAASSSSTPLLDAESAEQSKWASRLEAIGKRAGSHAKLFQQNDQSSELSQAESTKLRQFVLISGARTMSMHIRSFERWETWADQRGVVLYPLTVEKFLKFLSFA